MKKTFITVLIIATACGAAHITRINDNGAIIAGPNLITAYPEFGTYSTVSETGYIYLAYGLYLNCYTEGLDYVTRVDNYGPNAVTVDNVRSSVYSYSYINGQRHITVRGPTLEIKYDFDTPAGPYSLTVDESDASVWFIIGSGTYKGLYKYDDEGEEIYYFPEYPGSTITRTASDGSFWTSGYSHGLKTVRHHLSDGTVSAETQGLREVYYITDTWTSEGSLWAIFDPWNPFHDWPDSELYKFNILGNPVLCYTGIDRMKSLSVNQNDGSVWISSVDGDIVHLDSNGGEIKRIKWFETYVFEIATDPIDNSVIIFSGSSIPASIQPSSLGEIKAMFR